MCELRHLPQHPFTGDTDLQPFFSGLILLSEARTALARETFTARLDKKTCISESAQCYHFEFVLDTLPSFPFVSGQFISAVATDLNGKQQTRAYSIASAANANRFDLCVNRVEGGFFSNHLADLTDLQPGGSIQVHGPHGHFILKEPVTDSILIATGTGIAPMRGFAQWLFPENGPDRSNGKEIWLVYGTRHETEIYYHDEFVALAANHPNFHYIVTLSRAVEDWTGNRGYVQEYVAKIVEERAARLGIPLPQPAPDPLIPVGDLRSDIYSYICGLNNMVSGVRDKLAGYGWDRKQIIFERYD
jgi:ferredoxin-NADP reductase